MADSNAFMSVNFLPTFIEAYRNHRCLWFIKSKEYSNKQVKDNAYKELVDLAREVVPNCNVDFIKKKIDLIRGSFRREHKKVQASMKSGAGADSVYNPKLWYYKLLLFLSDQEEVRSSTSNLTEELVVGDEEEDKSSEAQESIFNEEQESLETSLGSVKRNVPPSSASKRQKLDKEADKSLYLQKAVSILSKPDDDFDLYGKSVAAQLRKLDPLQNIYAQHIINQVIFQGKLNKLQENTTIYNPFQYSSTPTTSPCDSGKSTPYYQELMPTTVGHNNESDELLFPGVGQCPPQ